MKKIVNIIILVVILCSISTGVIAKPPDEYDERDERLQQSQGLGTIDTDNFKPPELTESDYGTAFEITGKIVESITIIGVAIAIVGVIILGIKYMMGSVEEKAEYKKTMWPYLVGCLFIFAISTIVSIIFELATKL